MDIKKGDIFLLGRNRLMCGDSLKLTNVHELLDGHKADMMFTDPPYNIDYDRENHKWKHTYKSKVKNFKDTGFSVIKLLELLNTGIMQGAVYMCCGTNQIGTIWDWCVKTFKRDPRMMIWYKNNMSISRSDYHRRYETVMYFWFKGKKFRGKRDGSDTDVWFIKNRVVSKYSHPTQKPVRLVQKAVLNSSDKGDIVMDLFGGSGSTMMACENTERRCFMMEMDPHYVDVIIKRWEAKTGQEAVKV